MKKNIIVLEVLCVISSIVLTILWVYDSKWSLEPLLALSSSVMVVLEIVRRFLHSNRTKAILNAGIGGFLLSVMKYVVNCEWRTTMGKESFERRSSLFYGKISPYLLEKVLPENAPTVEKKLFKLAIDGKQKIFPYIKLAEGDDFAIPAIIQDIRSDHFINQKFINWLEKDLQKIIEDNLTFSLNSISYSGEMSIYVGKYFAALSTSDIHYYNLIRYFPVDPGNESFLSYHYSKYVANWLDSLKKVVENKIFSHYCAAIGCSVLTVLKCGDGNYKYLIKGNDRKKNSAYDRHVIPSFMFGPVSKSNVDQVKELNIELSVIKEYGEELLNMIDLERVDTYETLVAKIFSNKMLEKLNYQIESKEAHFELTGLILDVYRLRPEITALLIVNDEEFAGSVTTGWETKKGSLSSVYLNDDAAYQDILLGVDGPMCPPGLAALVNGRNKAIDYVKGYNQ